MAEVPVIAMPQNYWPGGPARLSGEPAVWPASQGITHCRLTLARWCAQLRSDLADALSHRQDKAAQVDHFFVAVAWFGKASSMTADLEFALELADLADRISSGYFATHPVPWRSKADESPVTDADWEIEEALRSLVGKRYPADRFFGEEVGALTGGSRRWIVDGIDGTAAFAGGQAEWGTLIALEIAGEVAVGVASAPGLGRRWWAARGEGAWTGELVNGHFSGEHRRLSVSQNSWDTARASVLPEVSRTQVGAQ
jgi:Inositol monophosphatase family